MTTRKIATTTKRVNTKNVGDMMGVDRVRDSDAQKKKPRTVATVGARLDGNWFGRRLSSGIVIADPTRFLKPNLRFGPLQMALWRADVGPDQAKQRARGQLGGAV